MTTLGLTTRRRSAATSMGLMALGSLLVLVGVLAFEHVALVVLGLAALVAAGAIGAAAEAGPVLSAEGAGA